MAEKVCPECGCEITDKAFEKEGVLYCCEPCASGCECVCGCECGCGCLEKPVDDCR